MNISYQMKYVARLYVLKKQVLQNKKILMLLKKLILTKKVILGKVYIQVFPSTH